jgi:hypothetical protein
MVCILIAAFASCDNHVYIPASINTPYNPAVPGPDIYSITLSQSGTYVFAVASPGYGTVSPLTVTVTNTGTQATGALNAVLSGTGAGNFAISDSFLADIPAGGSASFIVGPKANLPIGTYKVTVSVSGGNGLGASFDVSFLVKLTFSSIPDIITYLSSVTGGASSTDAVPLLVSLNLASDWADLLIAIRD